MNIWIKLPRTASPLVMTALRSVGTASRRWSARTAPTIVPPAVSNALPCVVCVQTQSRAIVPSPSSSAHCARTSATGVQKNAARTRCLIARAVQMLAGAAPRPAARWQRSSRPRGAPVRDTPHAGSVARCAKSARRFPTLSQGRESPTSSRSRGRLRESPRH